MPVVVPDRKAATRRHIAFAAGDVGGARALLPVARAAQAAGHRVTAMDHGPLRREGSDDWGWRSCAAFADPEAWHGDGAPDILLYATSVADWAAVDSARAAQAAGQPCLHVLDNWSNYVSRLRDAAGAKVIPDLYAVMDTLAEEAAIGDGVPPGLLSVTGHPTLAALADEASSYSTGNLADPSVTRLLLPSEPALADGGGRFGPAWRGYDEVEVSVAYATALRRCAETRQSTGQVHVRVAPHPREDRQAVSARWEELLGPVSAPDADPANKVGWSMVDPEDVRRDLHQCHAVVGMTSILLYEAWLLGKPVMSLQPNLRIPALAAIGQRKGVVMATDLAQTENSLKSILKNATMHQSMKPSPNRMALHVTAPARILALAESVVDRMSRSKELKS